MPTNLKQKTIDALVWSFLERFCQQGVQFFISVILARLLLPEEYGLVAMLTIFIAVAQSFIDSGFGQALIQKKNSNFLDECSIFYFNVFVGLVAAGLLCLLAPMIADFYRQPLLVPLTYALSLNLIFNSFSLIQTSLLIKHINFKVELIVSLIATSLSGGIGIAMAMNGFGVWSIVAQSVSRSFFRTISLWSLSKWRPTLAFSFKSLTSMLSFGFNLLLSGLLDTIFQNIYFLVIGKLFSPGLLGFYSRAKGLQQMFVANMALPMSRVAFPVFSGIQNDKVRLKRFVKKALKMNSFINFPIMIGLIVVAEPFVALLLTKKWLPCVPYFKLLCIVGLMYPLQVINLNVLKSLGRSDLFFRLEILKKILISLAILSTYRFGVLGLLLGQVALSFLSYILNSYYTSKFLSYGIWEQMSDVAHPLFLGIVMGVIIHFFFNHLFEPEQYFLILLVQIPLGIVIYASLCHFTKLSSFYEAIQLIRVKFIKPVVKN